MELKQKDWPMNLDKFNIGKGAAIGVLFGYFVSLRFGPIIGVVLSFARRYYHQCEGVYPRDDGCAQNLSGFTEKYSRGVACFRKKMEDPLEKIVDALTDFLLLSG